MAVDDHGLEVLKKSGEEVVPGQRGDMYIKTKVINGLGEPIPVYITTAASATAVTVSQYNEQSSVASASETDIVTYTVPIGKKFFLQIAEASCTNIARFTVVADASTVARKYTWFSGGLSADFCFAPDGSHGVEFPAGTVIKIKGLHNRPDVGDFSARIQGSEDDI